MKQDPQIEIIPHDWYFEHRLVVDGEGVSWLSVVDLTMRVGVATVHMGGIAGVGTKRDQRKKGYSRRVLENSNVWMREAGFDCAVLFGIDNYYDKFGYAVCLPECRYEVRTRYAETASRSLRARPYTEADLPALRALYAAENADRTGTLDRGDTARGLTRGSAWARQGEITVFVDGTGEVLAYIGVDVENDASPIEDDVVVFEVGARRPQYFSDIVRWAAERAVEMRVDTLTFFLPSDSLFGAYLTTLGAEQKVSYPRNGGGMGRLLNPATFFEKTLPEWTRRAQSAPGLKPGRTLRLETDIGDIALHWTGEAVEMAPTDRADGLVRLPQWRLMQFAMGYHGAEPAGVFPEVALEGETALFQALFPRRLPYIWRVDHF